MSDEISLITKDNPYVEYSYLPTEAMKELSRATNIFMMMSVGWGFIIIITSIVVVSNTIRLAMLSRKETIDVMKLIGAEPSFIRMPFLLEGILQGLFSGSFSVLILQAVQHIADYINIDIIHIPVEILWMIGIFGIIFGTVGSRIAINKYV